MKGTQNKGLFAVPDFRVQLVMRLLELAELFNALHVRQGLPSRNTLAVFESAMGLQVPRIFRLTVGLMGYKSREKNINRFMTHTDVTDFCSAPKPSRLVLSR